MTGRISGGRRRLGGRLAAWIDRYEADRCDWTTPGHDRCVRKPGHRTAHIVEDRTAHLRVWTKPR